MDFLDRNLTFSKRYKNLFIKGKKRSFIFDLLNLSISKPSHKKKRGLKKLGEKKNESIFYNYINPNDPAVKPTAAKNMNSIKSLGAEFINKLIWDIIL